MAKSSKQQDVSLRPRKRLLRWRVRNFKSLRRFDEELGGLTLLVGANSAGKSSLIQSILLFKQAQRARQERPQNFPLNGSLVRLGSFDDVLNSHADPRRDTVEIGGTVAAVTLAAGSEGDGGPMDWSGPVLPSDLSVRWAVSWSTAFEAPDKDDLGRMRVRSADLAGWRRRADDGEGDTKRPCSVSIRLARDLKRRSPAAGLEPVLSQEFFRSVLGRAWPLADYRGSLEEQGTEILQVRVKAGSPDAGLPAVALQGRPLSRAVLEAPWSAVPRGLRTNLQGLSQMFRRAEQWGGSAADQRERDIAELDDFTNSVKELYRVYLKEAAGSAGPDASPAARTFAVGVAEAARPYVFGVNESSLFIRRNAPRALRESGLSGRALMDPGAEEFGVALRKLEQYLAEDIAYLGPLRSTPRSLPRAYGPQDGVGVEGEFTAAVFHAEREKIVDDWDPKSRRPVRRSLIDAVSYWLRRLQIAESVTSRDRARDGIEILVKPIGFDREVNLRNVGVGTNQILPVVILCLRATPGSLILLEQPELHLHPAAQQELADFFICMMNSGRQIIVETHGEHLVSRLRRRVAEDPNSELLRDLCLLFAERSPTSGTTKYRRVEPNDFGGIEEWPKGFFDQASDEAGAILQAAIRKKTLLDNA
jgi:predicted ATPase